MSEEKIKKGYYRGIPVYVRKTEGAATYEEGIDIVGRTWLGNKLLGLMLWIDTEIIMVEHFKLWIEEEKK